MIGIDEVGRGCWAGPLLVVAARQVTELPAGLADSKKLSKKQRERLLASIEASCQLGEGWVQPAEIDQLGLTAAMRLAVKRALVAINATNDEAIIMDGDINYCDLAYTNVSCLVAADASHPIVIAASIYAKVTRDQAMADLSVEFAGYGFDKHVGYGTKAHLDALKALGVTSHHRKSYKPIQALL